MKDMKPIHYLVLLVLLSATVLGAMVILGVVDPDDIIRVVAPEASQTEPPKEEATQPPEEPATEEATEAPTEEATEPPTEAPTEPQPQSFVLTFVGDCTLGCNAKMVNMGSAFPKTVGEDYGYPFRNVITYFENDDHSFANLEGTLGDKGKAQNKKYVFRGIAEYTRILTENSVDTVTLANNHSFDYGEEGYGETKRLLEEAGVPYVEHLGTNIVTTDSGLVIGLIAADFTRITPDKEQLQEQILQLKDGGAELIVCAFHWGRENTFRATEQQKEYGHAAIDAGANIVWGHHPHVLQPMESYNGGIIYYSLGNFAFGGNSAPKDLDTALVQQEVIREADGSIRLGETTIVPCSVNSAGRTNNFQPTPYAPDSEEYARVMSKLDGSYKGGNLPIG